MAVVNAKDRLKQLVKLLVKHLWDKGQMWPLFAQLMH